MTKHNFATTIYIYKNNIMSDLEYTLNIFFHIYIISLDTYVKYIYIYKTLSVALLKYRDKISV